MSGKIDPVFKRKALSYRTMVPIRFWIEINLKLEKSNLVSLVFICFCVMAATQPNVQRCSDIWRVLKQHRVCDVTACLKYKGINEILVRLQKESHQLL